MGYEETWNEIYGRLVSGTCFIRSLVTKLIVR